MNIILRFWHLSSEKKSYFQCLNNLLDLSANDSLLITVQFYGMDHGAAHNYNQ